MSALLKVSNLSVTFPGLAGDAWAVRDCSLEVAPGEILGLVGESGSGKSVAVSACMGLSPASSRVSGDIRLDGKDVLALGPGELRKLRGGTAAMIFQNPGTALNPFFTIGTQMCEAIRRHRNLDQAAARQSAIEGLEAVAVADSHIALDKYPHEMSGGQLQRVMIAMALACEPALLIADEPTTALDVTVQAQILVLLRALAKSRGLSVLFITHDLGVVAMICDRVAVMYAGSIVETASVDELFANPAHPYTRALIETVPELGRGKQTLSHITGTVPSATLQITGCAFRPRCAYASSMCDRQTPALKAITGLRQVACHHPLSINASGSFGST